MTPENQKALRLTAEYEALEDLSDKYNRLTGLPAHIHRLVAEVEELREANERLFQRQLWLNDKLFEREQEVEALRAREWVGLDGAEIDEIRSAQPSGDYVNQHWFYNAVRAIEAKLREKNA